MKKLSLLFTVLMLLSIQSISQVAINTDGTDADESSILHVKSTDKGLLIPRMTESQRLSIANPATGLIVYQINGVDGFYYNAGSSSAPSWIKLSSTSTSVISDADGDTKVEVEQTTDEDNIVFTVANTEAMIIDENANVGIGTNSPSGILHINQLIEFSGEAVDQIQNTANVGWSENTLMWQSFTAGSTGYLSKIDLWDAGESVGTFSISVYEGQGVSGTLLGSTNHVSRNNDPYGFVTFSITDEVSINSGQVYTFALNISGAWLLDLNDTNPYSGGVCYTAGAIYPDDDARFKTYVSSTVTQGPLSFIINSEGNVGIGTTAPTQKLEVEGNLKVIGNIIQEANANLITDEIRAEGTNGLKLNDDGGNGITVEDGGNISIGNGSAVSQLTVYRDATSSAGMCVSDESSTVQTWFPYVDGSNYITGDFSVSGTGHTIFRSTDGVSSWNRMVIQGNDGLVGINTMSPTAVLSVNGAADKPGGGSWSVFSDSRSKENIKIYNRGLTELLKLSPVFFNYKEEYGWGTKTYVGLVAQDVEKVIPDMVNEIMVMDIEDFKRVDPSELTYLLINAIKDQQEQIDELKKQNKRLEERLNQLEKSKIK